MIAGWNCTMGARYETQLSWCVHDCPLSCMPPQNPQKFSRRRHSGDRQQHNTFRGTSLNLSQSQTLWNLPELSQNTHNPERKPTLDPCQNNTFYIEYIDAHCNHYLLQYSLLHLCWLINIMARKATNDASNLDGLTLRLGLGIGLSLGAKTWKIYRILRIQETIPSLCGWKFEVWASVPVKRCGAQPWRGFMMHFKYHRYHNGIIICNYIYLIFICQSVFQNSCETCPIFKWVSGLRSICLAALEDESHGVPGESHSSIHCDEPWLEHHGRFCGRCHIWKDLSFSLFQDMLRLLWQGKNEWQGSIVPTYSYNP